MVHGIAMEWDPGFLDRSPMFAPLAAHAESLRVQRAWPSREALGDLVSTRAIATAGGAQLRLVAPSAGNEPYEAQIHRRGELQTREENWHDLFNVLTWLTYPRAKSEIARGHYNVLAERANEASAGSEGAGRGRMRDALTLFDESGLIVAASEPDLLDDVRELRWKRLFRERRDRVCRAMRFYTFGHAILEKALRPYVGMTGHAVLLSVDADFLSAPLARQIEALDGRVASEIRALTTPRALAPLPVLGIPGWWTGNEQASFYDDERYFRAGRTRSEG